LVRGGHAHAEGVDSVDLDKEPLPDGYRVELIEQRAA
jgi:hypothetical protein